MRIVKQDSQIQFPTFSQQPNMKKKKTRHNPHKSQLSHCAQKMQNETEDSQERPWTSPPYAKTFWNCRAKSPSKGTNQSQIYVASETLGRSPTNRRANDRNTKTLESDSNGIGSNPQSEYERERKRASERERERENQTPAIAGVSVWKWK